MGLVVAESVLIALIGGALGVLGSQGILWFLTHAPGMKSLVATVGLSELSIPPLVAALGFANAVSSDSSPASCPPTPRTARASPTC